MNSTPTTQQEHDLVCLRRLIAPELFTAPLLDWNAVEADITRYCVNTLAKTDWLPHLAFAAVVLTCHTHLKRWSRRLLMKRLHYGFRCIREGYPLPSFADWNPRLHGRWYKQSEQHPTSVTQRYHFISAYTTVVEWEHAYLDMVPAAVADTLRAWVLPPFPIELHETTALRRRIKEEQHLRRKVATDSIDGDLKQIRAAAHQRWNRLSRLYTHYCEAVKLVEDGQEGTPLFFHYAEGPEDLHFVLWTRRQFYLAHADDYRPRPNRNEEIQGENKRECFFLEYRGAEQENGQWDTETLCWFGDLLREGVFSRSDDPLIHQRQNAFLQAWGYDTVHQKTSGPFLTRTPGILHSNRGTSKFLTFAQQFTPHLLFVPEPLYVAATFGLAALDILTTTGARMNELQQVSVTPECLYTSFIDGQKRYLMRLVPKGRSQAEEYFVSRETKQQVEKILRLLQDHYQLQVGSPPPVVPFGPDNSRKDDFPARPYLFQYQGQHLLDHTVNACMRFLCHGLLGKTCDGRQVILTSHLFRHAFATHAARIVPLDILAKLLHHRDFQVTRYYSEPTQKEVLTQAGDLLDQFATHLGAVEEWIQRSPEDLQQQLQEARERVGTLARVTGGECTCHAICPFSLSCVGCVHKVPDPTRRHELTHFREVTMIRLEQVTRRNLRAEISQQRTALQRCDNELAEMTLMEAYQHDEAIHTEMVVEHER